MSFFRTCFAIQPRRARGSEMDGTCPFSRRERARLLGRIGFGQAVCQGKLEFPVGGLGIQTQCKEIAQTDCSLAVEMVRTC